MVDPVANFGGHAFALEVRDRKARDRPRREAAHALHHRWRERARECDPALRLAVTRAVEYRAHHEEGGSARALHDASHAVAADVQLSGGDSSGNGQPQGWI